MIGYDLFQDDDEREIRQAWLTLYRETLPHAARQKLDWPVEADHCFARLLLDNAVGQYWRDVIKPPAWRHTPLPVLQRAIDLGDAILTGDADIWALNDASLVMRGKALKGKSGRKPRRRKNPYR